MKMYEINDFYLTMYPQSELDFRPAFLKGIGGGILITSLLAEHSDYVEAKDRLKRQIQILMTRLHEEEALLSTFADGLAGIGCLIIYLNKKNQLNNDAETLLLQVDELLSEQLDALLEEKIFDFLHGAIGLGLYFLVRKRYDITARVIQVLNLAKDGIIF